MCTLVAWMSVFPEAPLVVAANRDENLGRPSGGPRRHEGRRPYVAPVDLVAGGSWWAINEQGLFVGLTNRAGAMVADVRRSRGLLVTDLAQCADVDEARGLVDALDPAGFNGFHLLVTDGRTGLRVVADGRTKAVFALSRGMQVLTERGFSAAPHSRDERVQALFGALSARALDVAAVESLLASHHDPAIDALCVHVPEADYGTRSSTVLVRPAQGPATLLFAPGPPCTTAYENLSALLS